MLRSDGNLHWSVICLDRLLAPAVPAGNRLLNGLMVVAVGVLLLSGVFLTVAHTACCLVPVG